MLHFAVRAVEGTLLFRTHAEASAVWRHLTTRVLLVAAVLMPDHLHVLAGQAQRSALAAALQAYAQSRNRNRGESGPAFRHDEKPEFVLPGKLATVHRYIHLNPCRERLADDPLAWPWSTHRDAVGLALPAVCRIAEQPARFHAYVSGDPSVNPAGTPLPEAASSAGSFSTGQVLAAVSALTRTTEAGLRARGPARDLFARAARVLTGASSAEIGERAGMDASAVRRRPRKMDREIAVVARVAGDARFALLDGEDLRSLRSWRAYRGLR